MLHSHKALSHISKGCRSSSWSTVYQCRLCVLLQHCKQGAKAIGHVWCAAVSIVPRTRHTFYVQTESWQMEGGVRPSGYKRARQALVQEEPASMEEEDECARDVPCSNPHVPVIPALTHLCALSSYEEYVPVKKRRQLEEAHRLARLGKVCISCFSPSCTNA